MSEIRPQELMDLVAEHGLIFDPLVCEHLVAAIETGSNIILTGAPGTGKTSLAYLMAQLGRRHVRCTGYHPVTATSAWTTDVTIGRYERSGEGLIFQPGIFLEAIETGRWLVVDELNRSDFDQAFGQLFTVLSGQPVTLPFHRRGSEEPISLVPSHAEAPEGTDVIAIPHAWRMIATMNVVDKDLLHRLSYALMRRFAFIEVTSPSEADFVKLLDRPGGEIVVPLLAIRQVRDLGPAIFLDGARFADYRSRDDRSESRVRYEVFCSYILPQLDGCTDAEARHIYETLEPAFDQSELAAFRHTIRNISSSPRDGGRAHTPPDEPLESVAAFWQGVVPAKAN